LITNEIAIVEVEAIPLVQFHRNGRRAPFFTVHRDEFVLDGTLVFTQGRRGPPHRSSEAA
jgi:hypothetical protein